jgi:hypothetical protein
MVELRPMSRRRYVMAGILTALIFSLGLLLGMVVEGQRVDFVQKQSNEQRLDISSLQIQYAFIDQLAQEMNCAALARSFDKNVHTLETTQAKLESYYDSASVKKEEFEFIRREYTLAQFNYWMFAKRYKDLCHANLTTVLFFYESKCDRCDDQGFVLSYLKNIFKERLLNFAINGGDSTEPMVEIIKSTYDVHTYPTLVIDGEKTEGFVSRDILLQKICIALNSTINECGLTVSKTVS